MITTKSWKCIARQKMRLRKATEIEVEKELAFRAAEWEQLKKYAADGHESSKLALEMFESLYTQDGKLIEIKYVSY